MTDLLREASALDAYLKKLFQTIHQNPELGRAEHATAQLIRRELEFLRIEVTSAADTGVVGTLRGALPGRTVALRADIDALPIQEETGLPYASRVPGVMHACGHDFHTAALLGAAVLLARRREKLSGTVKFFFQPDEEGEGGAQRMIGRGCMAAPAVDAVFACHVDTALPVGTASVRPGPVSAASDPFSITLRGRGSHGAKPHLGDDVIVAGSQLVSALQTIASRRTAPTDPVVVTVGTFHAGIAGNILPQEAVLTGILRTLGEGTRERVRGNLRSVVSHLSAAMGVEAEVEITPSYPACRNDRELTDLFRRSAADVLGAEHILEQAAPSMGTDDFGYFSQSVPGCYWNIGVGNAARGFTAPNHSPKFAADPAALSLAAAIHTRTVLDFLGEVSR